jgi:uncharacterized protein YbbK (DUF523 family)
MTTVPPPRIGISRCLLGENVRHDGGNKLDRFLVETLSRFVEWVPVCPEVEIGLSTPREAMQLVGDPRAPRLITITTGVDHTEAMEQFSQRRLVELEALALSGFIFKARSPSCGIEGVGLGAGLFARAFMEHFPMIPVEDEGQLHNPQAVKDFLERVTAYRRQRTLAP